MINIDHVLRIWITLLICVSITTLLPHMQASDVSEDLVVAIDSDQAFLCREEEGGKLKVLSSSLYDLK